MPGLDLCEYDRQREIRVAQNKQFLDSLGLPDKPLAENKPKKQIQPSRPVSPKKHQTRAMSDASETQSAVVIPARLEQWDTATLSAKILQEFPGVDGLTEEYLKKNGLNGHGLAYAVKEKMLSDIFSSFSPGFRMNIAAWTQRLLHRSPVKQQQQQRRIKRSRGACF